MKNRPLCSLCLVIAILIGILTAGAGAKFVSELRPSPVEQYGEKDDWLIVRGQVYKKEEKEKYSTPYTMVDLEYDDSDVVECLKDLTIKEYSETLVDKDNLEPPLLYVFGKDISNKQVYIKVKIKGDKAKYVLCVSFHYAEYEMSFPYFK